MNKILEVNEEGMYMVVEAGVRTIDIQNLARSKNLMPGDTSPAREADTRVTAPSKAPLAGELASVARLRGWAN